MKVLLYMAVTPNGFIAKSDDDTSWISKEEWSCYSEAVRRAGNLVVGRRTYNILTKQPEFSELKEVRVVVVSQKNFPMKSSNHFIAHSPREALKQLKNFKEVVVAGGGILNSSFMKENLIDEIYLDVEPILFGKGIRVFLEEDFEARLELVGTKKISNNEIQIHYRVKK